VKRTGRARKVGLRIGLILVGLGAVLYAAVRLCPQCAGDPALSHIPLVELPALSSLPYLAVFVTGDGGWVTLDRRVSEAIASAGVSVVVFNSLRYFWYRRTPEQAAADLSRLLEHYCREWDKTQIILIGYSRGADVLPFMASRLPAEQLEQVRLIALLGAASSVSFQPLLIDWLGLDPPHTALPLVPELRKLAKRNVLCYYGAEERDSVCHGIEQVPARCVRLPGGHHFDGRYAGLAALIVAEIE